MKKINLIKWLWKTDSHEKQKPQRFARYAAILIMLLTLGVGQMWASKIVYFVNKDSWSTPKCHHWQSSNSGNSTSWPGDTMVDTGNKLGSYKIFSCTISDDSHDRCIFSNNGSNQTGDLTIPSDAGNRYYYNGNWLVTFTEDAVVYFTMSPWWTNHSGSGCYHNLTTNGPSGTSSKIKVYQLQSYLNDNSATLNNTTKAESNIVMFATIPAGTYSDYTMYRGSSDASNWNTAGSNTFSSSSNKDNTTRTDGGSHSSWTTYQATSTASLAATSTSITTAQTSTLTPSLTSNTRLNKIKSTSYSVTNNPGSAGSVTSEGVFSATAAGSYTVTATVTYNAKGFPSITKKATATKNITVTSASTATLTYHANWYTTGTSGSVPSSQTVDVDATATVAGRNTLAMTNYTFSGWNTEEYITGTHYDAGDDITMDENKDLYAVWTRSITLNQNGATTNGTTSVTGTYNCSTLPSITNPKKTGYTFVGWRTENNGTGNLVINTSGQLQSNVYHWTDRTTPSNRFQRNPSSTSPLYATWTQDITLNANTANHGSGTNKTATVTYNSTAVTSITHCTPATDYELEGYYTDATSGTKILNADGTFAASSITNYITSSKWTKAGATTLYAQYTPIPVKLLYGSSTPLNSPTDGGAMSYDATEHAYYKDVTTNSSPYYFRFDYNSNSEQYSGNWTSYPDVVEAVANGSKVDCNQTVKGWDNKGSIKFTGANGSSIRIWFDYQNKKAWITEPGYSVTINNGDHGTVSPNGVRSVGASGLTITATPTEGYKLASWNVTGGAHVASSTSATTTLTATADGTVTAIYETESPIRLYYSNPAGWSKVYAYLWDEDNTSDKNANFPGTDITTNIELVDCQQYYYYYEYYPSAHVGWDRIIFNGGNSSMQTHDLPFSAATNAGQYQNAGKDEDGSWQDTSNPWYFAYNDDSWNTEDHPLTCTSVTSGYVELDLAANTDYAFKFVENGSTWYGCTEATKITYENKATAQTMNNTNGGSANQTIKTAGAGTYRFTWDITNKRVTVTYPTSYTVTFGYGTGGSAVTATVEDATTITTGQYAASGKDITFTKTAATGYHFKGWYDASSGGSAIFCMSADDIYDDIAGNINVYAQFDPNSYTVTLDVDEEHKGSTAGADESASVTYNAAPTTIANRPTAAEGYGLDGYYTGHNGSGTKLINGDGTWIASVDGYTDGSKRWIHADDVTLYAYYKKAEITAITFDEETVEAGRTVSFAVTISPTPTGTTKTCFTVLHSNDNPLAEQPTITYSAGKYSFTAPATSGTYKIYAVLRTGSSCDGGTELDTEEASFQVAGLHDVTVRYKCGDDVIKAATTLEGIRPLVWSDEITAPEIFGYTFSSWTAGDGVTISTDGTDPIDGSTTSTSDIYIKAVYDGYLTANYTQNAIIYFKNTLGWSDVYVNFLGDLGYWNNPKGSGNNSVTNQNKQMTQIDDTDIWYYDYGAASITPTLYVSFTSESQSNKENFWKSGGVNVVYPANYPDAINIDKSSENGFKAATPMFVPLASQDKVTLNSSDGGWADYYNAGYWTKYTPGTGYTLEIYNEAGNVMLKSVEFTSEDELMPMKAVVDLEAGHTYKYQLRRGGTDSYGIYYGNSGTMTYANHGSPTPWDMTNGSFSMCGITTNAAGDYTFNLSYSGNSSTPPQYRLRMAVDYPVALGDFRMVYSDNDTWGRGVAHTLDTWIMKSHPITHRANGVDTVSFFISKGHSPEIRWEKVTAATGTITYGTTGEWLTTGYTDVSESGVYNFKVTQNADGSGISSIERIGKYTGNYYIRTDCANSKWDNYKSDPDHLMTYSEYSIDHGGYSHYYCHWVQTDDRKNIKFVIANDYSPSISDTLTREIASGDWTNITYYVEANGDIKRNANVRFMWNQSTNKISRAYVDGAQGDNSDNFLYMLNTDATDKIKWADGSALTSKKVTFLDNGNWIYEANLKAQPEAKIRLLSNWGTSNTLTQYFKGTSSTSVDLIGGSGSNWYDIRVIYDFKTNRLLASWVPSGEITDETKINADVMFIREHQGDINQLFFSEDGKITEIKTAYGVLRFNKWTINNKSKADGHAPLSPLLSRYERDLFYVSFPFRVSMEEVFGFGTYGTHWIIEYYDGASRAANGYWQESGPNWKFVTNRKNKFFEPNQGYIIALELDLLNESSDIWANTDVVELYFPSYGDMPDITKDDITLTLPSHQCTIDRSGESNGHGGTLGSDYDRRVKDSHWNVMSVPTYVNPGAPDFANTKWTTAGDTTLGPNFLYEWNMDDNSVTAVSGATYTYHAMHAYLVQYWGNVKWSSSVSPAAAPRMNPGYRGEYEFRLELKNNDATEDQTFVKLSDNEAVTTEFEFNYDMSKEFNKKKANIYTMTSNNETVAGNCLPLTGQKTIVPVGVQIKTEGEYTFSMPDGTEGIGITLIDNETGEHTNLGLTDYTVNLNAGSINDRFVLEISPVSQTTTDIETVTGNGVQGTGVRKVMIDGILYIVRDGKVFDARGARVQ